MGSSPIPGIVVLQGVSSLYHPSDCGVGLSSWESRWESTRIFACDAGRRQMTKPPDPWPGGSLLAWVAVVSALRSTCRNGWRAAPRRRRAEPVTRESTRLFSRVECYASPFTVFLSCGKSAKCESRRFQRLRPFLPDASAVCGFRKLWRANSGNSILSPSRARGASLKRPRSLPR